MCLAEGHNAVTPVRLEAAASRSRVKHTTTESLLSLPRLKRRVLDIPQKPPRPLDIFCKKIVERIKQTSWQNGAVDNIERHIFILQNTPIRSTAAVVIEI